MTDSGIAPSRLTAYDVSRGTVDLRPLQISDILDGAFTVYRSHKGPIVATVLVIMVPIQLLSAFIQREAISVGVPGLFGNTATSGALSDGGSFATSLLVQAAVLVFVAPILAGALALIALRSLAGETIDPRDIAMTTLKQAGWLIAASIVTGSIRVAFFLLAGVGFAVGSAVVIVLCIVLGVAIAIAATPLFAVITPALMTGDRPPVAAFTHAIKLARRGYGKVFGTILVTGLVYNVLAFLLSGIPNLFGILGGFGYGWVLVGGANVLSQLIAAPLTAAAMVLLHQDLRIRQEAMDFDVLLARVGAGGPQSR